MIRTSQAQAAAFILTKNYLAAGKARQLLPLVKEVVGLPGEPALTPFLAASARLAHFGRADLLAQLYHQHRLIKSILMRSANYIVTSEDFLTFHAATARQRNQDFNSEFRLWGLDNSEVEALEIPILEALGSQPATVESIIERLAPSLVRELSQTSRGGRVSATSNVQLILRWLVARGVLGTRPADPDTAHLEGASPLTYAPLSVWYPHLNLAAAPHEAEAQAALVQTYLDAYGPVTEADISFWTGFGKSETARAINALAAKTTLTLVEGIPGMLLLLKEQAEALAATALPSQPVVNVLPENDPFVTAHRASRSRYFTDQKLQRHVFSSTGAAQPTLLLNGQIIGTWALAEGEAQKQLTWRLLTPMDPAVVPLLQTEIEKVAAFIAPNLAIVPETDAGV